MEDQCGTTDVSLVFFTNHPMIGVPNFDPYPYILYTIFYHVWNEQLNPFTLWWTNIAMENGHL